MNGYKIKNQNALHFITPTVVGWIDVFTRNEYKRIIIESLRYCCEHKGLHLYAYVIMSNHMHMIVKAEDGYELSNILRDFKRHTSRSILRLVIQSKKESRKKWLLSSFKYHAKFNKNNKTYQLWKRDNHPVELLSPKWISIRINYIHKNPVVAGIVDKPENYIYSSARNYLNLIDVKIHVEIIEFGSMEGYVFM